METETYNDFDFSKKKKKKLIVILYRACNMQYNFSNKGRST